MTAHKIVPQHALSHHVTIFKVNGYNFRGNNSTIFCPCSQWGSTLKGKNLLPRRKFFHLRVDYILKELCPPAKQIGSHGVVSLYKIGNNQGGVPIHLIVQHVDSAADYAGAQGPRL